MADDDRSRRVLELCDQAFALPEGERAQFLDEACVADSQLRAMVNSVLIAVTRAGNFLKTDDDTPVVSADMIGRRIGNYEIKEKLGEGGMGSVYLADRHEEGFEQRVAIKFVHGHLLAKELIERFNDERQILAALNHPYIAALIDSGTTDEGVPYIVMEFIDGDPIDQYCNRKKLGIADRIRLIQKVAMAVQAAHQNLIVHRDLKPSNVLITPDGIPKLLDFGIAKLIQPLESDEHSNTTIFGHQAMTPDYASPEQILENKVTTASDVYTLGVLTYQLLVGERPYHIQTSSHRDLIKSVEGLSIPKPSTRLNTIASVDLRKKIASQRATTIDKLRRTLHGDIDNILMMALRQEPERRYISIAQFSDDLDRYLDGLPVAAHADTFGYRAGKFLHRNWLPVGAAALVMTTLAGGIIAYAIQAEEAEKQRDIARAQANNAENTVGFLKDVLFAGDPFEGSENEQTVSDVLRYAEENLAERYADEPAMRATMLAALGEIHTARSNYERGTNLSSEAVKLYERVLGTGSNEAANAYRINALTLYYQDQYELADKTFRTAIDIYESLPDPHWDKLAMAYDQLGMVQGNFTDESVALEYYHHALQIYRDHALDDSAQLITLLGNIGTEYLQVGDNEAADPIFVEAIQVARENNASNAHIGILLSNYAGVLENLDRQEESTVNYISAIDLLVDALGTDHRETIVTTTSLAGHYRRNGELANAAITIQRAVTAAAASLPEVDFIHSYVQNIAAGIFCLGDDVTLGSELASASLASRRKLLPPDHWAISSGEGIVGMCHTAAGNYDIAEVILLKAYAELRVSRSDTHTVTLDNKKRLHQLYTAWGKPDLAAQYADTDQ